MGQAAQLGQAQQGVMAMDPGLQDETPLAVGGKLLLIGVLLLIWNWKK